MSLQVQLLEDMRHFKAHYANCFILSCRQQDYRGELSNMPTFILKQMNLQQMQQFVKQNTVENEPTRHKALQVIADSSQDNLRELLAIPLYSLMFVRTLRHDRGIAKSFVLLIKQFIEGLLIRESEKSDIDEPRFLLFLYRFAYLCVTERKNDNNTAVLGIDIEDMLQGSPKSSKQFLYDEVKLFLEFAQQLNILIKDKKQHKYSFVHPEYQIYFAAKGKQYFAPDAQLDYQQLHLYKLIRFDIGLSEQPHHGILELAEHNVLLASLCFQDEFNSSTHIKTQLIEQAQQQIQSQNYTLATFSLMFNRVVSRNLRWYFAKRRI